jgi:Leucine-rich repeat (LRR) protein
MGKHTFKTALNFQEVDAGTLENNVLVRDADGNVKEIPSNTLGGGIEIKGEYNNNGEAVEGGLVEGDIYSVPISSDAAVAYLAIVRVIPEPTIFIKLFFSDIITVAESFGISDINDVSQWNTFIASKYNTFSFDSASVSGNEVTLSKNDASEVSNVYLQNAFLIDIEIKGFDFLQYIYLDYNQLSAFDPSHELPALRELYLQNNNLTVFNPQLELPSLEALRLGNNYLTTFNPDNEFPELRELYIQNNNLTEFLPANSMPKLFDLNLSNNEISEFNPVSPPLSDTVQILNLSHNSLTNFNPDYYPSLLWMLTLSYNGITEFDPTTALPSGVQSIYLSHNYLTEFDPTNHPLPDLSLLNLSNNGITEFDPTNSLPERLGVLNLSNNNLTDFNPTNHPLPDTIVQLYLSGNQLTWFDPSNPIPTNLYNLNLDNNLLTGFDPSNGLPVATKWLVLNNNQITVFNPLNVLLNNLELLDLNSNLLLTTFNPDNALSSLTNLNLMNCGINTAGWAETDWISNVPDNGQIFTSGNPDAVTGTSTETLLVAKTWTVNA